jgi:hypothetical protein
VVANIVPVPGGQDKVFAVANPDLRIVDASDDGFSQLNPSPLSKVVRLGQEAMARKRRGWEDWLAIAEALEAGRTEVLRSLNSNEAKGRRYEKTMGDWLVVNGFKEINKATRSQLLECLKHKVEIEKWRSVLTDEQRFRFNHPDTVMRKWKASTVVPDPNAPKKPTPMQKIRDELVAVIEERDRYKREIERGGTDMVETGEGKKSPRLRDLWPDAILEQRRELFEVIDIDDLVAVLPNQLRQGLEERLVRLRGLQRSAKLTKFLRTALKSRSTATHITELVNHFNSFLTENNLDLEKVHVSVSK